LGREDYSLTTSLVAGHTVAAMFGEELKKAREAAGLTQEELAFKAEVHRTYVSLLERNRKSPTLDVLFRLSQAVGLSASRLVARVERSRPAR
jgi:transcriptional regulator with XRE-family HTH domain